MFFLCAVSGGTIELTNPDTGDKISFNITLPDVLAFITGARIEPAIGFDSTLSICFQESSPFPTANTCATTVYLPLSHETFDVFAYHVIFGICNAAGFGQI